MYIRVYTHSITYVYTYGKLYAVQGTQGRVHMAQTELKTPFFQFEILEIWSQRQELVYALE